MRIAFVALMASAAFWVASPCLAQELKMSAPTLKSLRVEYSYPYIVRNYVEKPEAVVGGENPFSEGSPEAVLLDYFKVLGQGDVDRAVSFWTRASQTLVNKNNATISRAELVDAMKKKQAGASVRFLSRIEYGDYLILDVAHGQLKTTPSPTSETYALRKEGGAWKLTQDLASDPVMCCWKTPGGRITRGGVPGDGFDKVLESLK